MRAKRIANPRVGRVPSALKLSAVTVWKSRDALGKIARSVHGAVRLLERAHIDKGQNDAVDLILGRAVG